MSLADTVIAAKYAHDKQGRKENWTEIAGRVTGEVVSPYFQSRNIERIVNAKQFIPGGRYLYAAGREFNQVNNCVLLDVEDSREGWADLMRRSTTALMTGAGVGVVYSKLRGRNAPIRGTGGESTGPCALIQMVNEAARFIIQGGSRRSALWAGLHWNHPDIFEFIGMKQWSDDIKALKAKDFTFPAPLDGTNISVILDDDFFAAYGNVADTMHSTAQEVYWVVVRQMLETGEPGFSIDVGNNAGEHLRNACTEVTSADNDDICNLGSLNLAQIDTIDQFEQVVDESTKFLLCGSMYSKLPYAEIGAVRNKNRRLGLGLMGVHEWLVRRGYSYGPNPELQQWLEVYAQSTGIAAGYADQLGISRPVKTRAVAPAGTISIVAETTSAIEPVFAKAFKRRYLKQDTWHWQYVVDSSAKRMLDQGADPSSIEDAYDLAAQVERRIEFQSFVQQFVDHGISSTINMPAWGTEHNNEETVAEFGKTLFRYLPTLRGVTVYPDGSRGGQPLTKVDLQEALEFEGLEYEEFGNENACVGGVCGL